MMNSYRPQRSYGKVMFLHLSVILFTGVSATPTPGKTHPPLGRHPLGRHPPPCGHPTGQTPPCTVHPGIRSTSGRYASYWNAYLFNFVWQFFNCWLYVDLCSIFVSCNTEQIPIQTINGYFKLTQLVSQFRENSIIYLMTSFWEWRQRNIYILDLKQISRRIKDKLRQKTVDSRIFQRGVWIFQDLINEI